MRPGINPVLRRILTVGVGLAVVGSGVAAAGLLGGSEEPGAERESAPRSAGRAAAEESEADGSGEATGEATGEGTAPDAAAGPGSDRGRDGSGAPASTCTMSPIQLSVAPSTTLAPGQAAAVHANAAYSCGPGPVTVDIEVTVGYESFAPFPIQLSKPSYVLSGSSVLSQTAQFTVPGYTGSYVVTVRSLVRGAEIARGTTAFQVVQA